jgi:hypothetical protein
LVATFLQPVLEKTGKLSEKKVKSSSMAFTSTPLMEAPEEDSSRTMHCRTWSLKTTLEFQKQSFMAMVYKRARFCTIKVLNRYNF